MCIFFLFEFIFLESLKINAFLISYMAYVFGIWFGQLVYLFVSKIQPSEGGIFNSSIFEHLNGLAYPFCKCRIVFSLSKKYCMLFLRPCRNCRKDKLTKDYKEKKMIFYLKKKKKSWHFNNDPLLLDYEKDVLITKKISRTEIQERWLEEIRLVINMCFIWGTYSSKSVLHHLSVLQVVPYEWIIKANPQLEILFLINWGE